MFIYKQYDQAALDRQYNNRLHAPDHQVHLDRWESLSRQTEIEFFVHRDIPYGKHPLEKLDIYPSLLPNARTLVFVHGGYWHKMDKSSFQFIARGFLPQGYTTVILNYPLLPEVNMDRLVLSCQNAFIWLKENLDTYNGNPEQIFVAGHSAGAHLAMMMASLSGDIINGILGISGIYDLLPIQLSYLNEMLCMDKAMAEKNSPFLLERKSRAPLLLAIGENESDEFKDQSTALQARWSIPGKPVKSLIIPGHNHFSTLETLINSISPLHQFFQELMRE